MADLSQLSDEELAARCKRNRIEEWLHAAGCFAGLAVGLVACATIITLGVVDVLPWSWCINSYLAITAFPVSVFSVYALFEQLARGLAK